MIDEQTEAVLKSKGFKTIDRPILEAIVEKDYLNITVVELLKQLLNG